MNRRYQQLKNVYHWLQAHLWRVRYGWPDERLKIYGVTGTNGKTTTSHILASILRERYGREKVGMLTTIAFWVGAREKVNKTKMTTLDSRLVYSYLNQMVKKGITQVVLEVTSHALDQNRLAGIKLEGAIILNIAREHLDYHTNMREYARAKLRIVSYLRAAAPLVISSQFSISNFQFPINFQKSIFKHIKKIPFSSDEARTVNTPLAGEWNKENALAAMKLARAVGVDEAAIKRGVEAVRQVPGRMEWVIFPPDKGGLRGVRTPSSSPLSGGGAPRVLIDYAVTPDALERLYRLVKGQTKGKVYAVLGACGNRDRGKRPLMAEAVAKYADELVITREDPWTEDEEQIFSDLEQGVRNPSNRVADTLRWQRIVDRREAIKYCLEKARPEDIVVVTGKGAEEGMAMGNEIIPWNDKKVILGLLEETMMKNDQ